MVRKAAEYSVEFLMLLKDKGFLMKDISGLVTSLKWIFRVEQSAKELLCGHAVKFICGKND
ncbi:hypothetical protein FIV31_07945 [Coxiella endosymbiont of Ornithodoros amblus]|nr:hypothetical protein [Coxiella endosymbiont of Ornithodoros amblus]